jgi:ABC-2 type transport system permease protein
MTASPIPAPWLFSRLHWRVFRNSWRTLFGRSILRPLIALFVVAIIWAFVYTVGFGGFYLLREHRVPLVADAIGIVLDLVFLALGVLLIFSGGLILYGGLFTSKESAFLLAGPAPDDRVFAYHFGGATGYSSWAFLLLGGPFMLAYGVVAEAPWYYYALLPLFFVGFLLLPASAGALICLLVVNFVPRRRKQVLILCIVGLVAAVAAWAAQFVLAGPPENQEAVHKLLARFWFAHGPLAPPHWAAEGLQAAVRHKPDLALWDLALVWSNGLFAYLIAAFAARRLFRSGFNRLATGGDLRRRYGGGWMDAALTACLPFVAAPTRLLIVKDFRTFRRDPQQWAQILIVAGFLGLYVTNFRRLWVVEITWPYQNALSLLNLLIVALLVCIYNSRFVFPLLSLEGRKFWVLGLLPLDRGQLLWGKFAFALTGSLIVAEPLILLSDWVIGMPWTIAVLHAAAVAVLAAGLSGLAVGLGALLPNFRETDPSKIAAGFGGTINLLASLLFVLLAVTAMAGPWHLQMAVASEEMGSPAAWTILLGVAAGIAVGVCAVAVPLRMGVTALRKMEF